jgi:hypothetical protein
MRVHSRRLGAPGNFRYLAGTVTGEPLAYCVARHTAVRTCILECRAAETLPGEPSIAAAAPLHQSALMDTAIRKRPAIIKREITSIEK